MAQPPVERFAEKWLENLSENSTEVAFVVEFVALGLVDVFEAEVELVHVLEIGAEIEAEIEAEVGMGSFAIDRENGDDTAASGCY